MELLGEVGVVKVDRPDDRLELALDAPNDSVHVRVIPEGATGEQLGGQAGDGPRLTVAKERLPELLETLFHKMRVQQLLVLPIGKWRRVFDVVAFSMATVEEWAEVDATASVRLNTRDPLLCAPPDLHTLRALIQAILSDADSVDQGILITTTITPVLVELHPDGCVHFTLSSAALASQVEKLLET
ncbi:MAG: hypothetical protein KDA22_08200 [Phycisphaerales bacterium]|nr:hypothetical protein [Phycisphaerales bacterium]